LLSLAINHMTSPASSFEGLVDLAVESNCVGVEVRNDLSQPVFSGLNPTQAGTVAKEKGIRILGIAQLNQFNCWSPGKEIQARQLVELAVQSSAESICLIPRNDGDDCESDVRLKNLRDALVGLAPLLKASGKTGLIEPLGFITSSLRSKAEVVDVINQLDLTDCFQLVHDTFHHHLAGGGACFPLQTGIMHVSGVTDTSIPVNELTDAHRALVDSKDTLDNIGQIKSMVDGGYNGPVSMEVFAPDVHQSPYLASQLQDSFDFINSNQGTEFNA